MKIGDVMEKSEAIRKVNAMSNFGLENGNTHFANIGSVEKKRSEIWWVEVPKEKFSCGFYFLFRCATGTLILLKIRPNALNLKSLYKRDPNKFTLWVCSNEGDALYMHDILGDDKVDLTEFIEEYYD